MARSEKVSYWRGHSESIPSSLVSGRLLVEEDTGNVFLDYRDNNSGELIRRQLTDTNKLNVSGGAFSGPVVLLADPDVVAESYPDVDIPNLAATKHYVDIVSDVVSTHVDDEIIHVSQSDRDRWDSKIGDVEYQDLQLSGVALGQLIIDGTSYTIYAPEITDIDGNAHSATILETPRSINGVNFDGSSNVSNVSECDSDARADVKKCDIPYYSADINSGTCFVSFKYADVSPGEVEPQEFGGAQLTEELATLGQSLGEPTALIHIDVVDGEKVFVESEAADPFITLWVNTAASLHPDEWYPIIRYLAEIETGWTEDEIEEQLETYGYFIGDYFRYSREQVGSAGAYRTYFDLKHSELFYQPLNWKIISQPDLNADIRLSITNRVGDKITAKVYADGQPIGRGVLQAKTYGFVFSDNKFNLLQSTDTTYDLATDSTSGLMSSEDKVKLDTVEADANFYELPEATTESLGGVIVGENISVNEFGEISITRNNIISTVHIFEGASDFQSGKVGLVPAPSLGQSNSYLKSDGTWSIVESEPADVHPIPDVVIHEICSNSIEEALHAAYPDAEDLKSVFTVQSYTDSSHTVYLPPEIDTYEFGSNNQYALFFEGTPQHNPMYVVITPLETFEFWSSSHDESFPIPDKFSVEYSSVVDRACEVTIISERLAEILSTMSISGAIVFGPAI